MHIGPYNFKHVIALDFEFYAPSGETPNPICLVTCNLETGIIQRYWEDDLRGLNEPPYPIGPDSLSIAYYAPAELSCFLSLGWPFPKNMLDLFTEFRCVTNGKFSFGSGLLDALSFFGIDSVGYAVKEEMRDLAIRGGPFSEQERKDLLEYCASDVIALQKLLPKMLPFVDVPRALVRGCYMGVVAQMERNGIPIDVVSLRAIENQWSVIQERLIARVNSSFNVYEGTTFKTSLFEKYLNENKVSWPRLPTGALDLKEQTFKEMSVIYPQLSKLHQLRTSLAQMRAGLLPVGLDGRNRTMLSAFGTLTGRNKPSTTGFVFSRAAWFRNLIQPPPGFAIAYVDWSQQEFAIAAALSGDSKMMIAYSSGDPYLEFGKQAGVIPIEGTKQTHKMERERFKQCALAVLYGGGPNLIASRTGLSVFEARELINAHKKSYPQFWKWIGAAVDKVKLGGSLHTVFGWQYRSGSKTKYGTLLNFPMQANGAEMLRLACCQLTQAGIKICAPIHDAILVEAPSDIIGEHVAIAQKTMADASSVILQGKLILRTDVKIIRYPNRYTPERGTELWGMISEFLDSHKPYCTAGGTQDNSQYPRTDTANLRDTRVPAQSYYLSSNKES